ncbi:MAG: LysE family transporter [Clostridium sp.]|jgi:threonine/homoserine/homoserine lactone efflux protein|nr:LysE family transporter [Clostridium sp.]
MVLWGMFLQSFFIGFSGAMVPGPMLGVTIDGSLKKGWKAGPLIVLGHGILEILLITVMILGLKDLFTNTIVGGIIGLVGGVFLAWMGYGMIKSGINKSVSLENQETDNSKMGKNLVLVGLVVSATNPYFTIWWASAGMELIRQALTIGLIGVIFFFAGHILADFVWYSAVSLAFSKGKKLISDNMYRWIIMFLGVFIIGFSIYFITSGLKMLFKG